MAINQKHLQAARERRLPDDWREHWSTEEEAWARLAEMESAAPASVPGMTKYHADGPSLHASMSGIEGSEATRVDAAKRERRELEERAARAERSAARAKARAGRAHK